MYWLACCFILLGLYVCTQLRSVSSSCNKDWWWWWWWWWRPAPKSHSAPQPQYVKPSVAWFIQSSVERLAQLATRSSPADRPAATSLSFSIAKNSTARRRCVRRLKAPSRRILPQRACCCRTIPTVDKTRSPFPDPRLQFRSFRTTCRRPSRWNLTATRQRRGLAATNCCCPSRTVSTQLVTDGCLPTSRIFLFVSYHYRFLILIPSGTTMSWL